MKSFIKNNSFILSGLVCVILIGIALLFQGRVDTGNENLGAFRKSGATEIGTFKTAVALSATTSSATSTEIFIAGAKKVTLYLARPLNTGAATSTFTVQVTIDGVNYFAYNKLVDNVPGTLTRIASKDVVGTSSTIVSLDLDRDAFIGMKCIAVIAGTGSHSCTALIEN